MLPFIPEKYNLAYVPLTFPFVNTPGFMHTPPCRTYNTGKSEHTKTALWWHEVKTALKFTIKLIHSAHNWRMKTYLDEMFQFWWQDKHIRPCRQGCMYIALVNIHIDRIMWWVQWVEAVRNKWNYCTSRTSETICNATLNRYSPFLGVKVVYQCCHTVFLTGNITKWEEHNTTHFPSTDLAAKHHSLYTDWIPFTRTQHTYSIRCGLL